MRLPAKIKAINCLFEQVDSQIAEFKSKSQLQCLSNCCFCCTKPNLEVTILEFLPAAFHLYATDNHFDILCKIEKQENGICVFLNPFSDSGNCVLYKYRGLICRLFGFSAKMDKHSTKSLITCKYVKKSASQILINNSIAVSPNIAEDYMKLFSIDPELTIKSIPINDAIRKAIEIVAMHYLYRKKPA